MKLFIKLATVLLSIVLVMNSLMIVNAVETNQITEDSTYLEEIKLDSSRSTSYHIIKKHLAKIKLDSELDNIIGNNDTLIEPFWLTSSDNNVHEAIIDYAQNNASTTIPSKYLSLVKTVSNWCDSKWSGSGDKPFRAVHGAGNYVATLKYLWYYTKKIAKHTDGSDLATDADAADVYAASKVITPPGGDRLTVYNQMRNMTKRIIKAHGENVSTNQSVAGRCKYIIYGLLMHLFGDLYSHRPLIPKKALTINDSTKRLKESDFYTVSEAAALSTNTNIVKSWEDVKRDVTNQIVTFTSIRTKYQKDKSCKIYEDNANFYPNRLRESKIIALLFLDDYSDGYYYDILTSVYGYSLENYDQYLEELGE